MTQEDVIPTCRELGIGIVAYSPLGRGFLTGQIKSRDDLAGALSACTLGCLHVHWGLCKYVWTPKQGAATCLCVQLVLYAAAENEQKVHNV